MAENSGIFLFTVLFIHCKGTSLQHPHKMAERDGIRTDVANLILTQVQQGLFCLPPPKKIITAIHKQTTNGYLY